MVGRPQPGNVYAVNYPRQLRLLTAADGASDATNQIMQIANTCPDTRIVLGGLPRAPQWWTCCWAFPLGAKSGT